MTSKPSLGTLLWSKPILPIDVASGGLLVFGLIRREKNHLIFGEPCVIDEHISERLGVIHRSPKRLEVSLVIVVVHADY